VWTLPPSSNEREHDQPRPELTTTYLKKICATTGPKWVALDQGDATRGVERVLLKKLCTRLGPRLAEDVRWTLDLDARELRVSYRGRGGSSRGRITLHLQYIPWDESRTWAVYPGSKKD